MRQRIRIDKTTLPRVFALAAALLLVTSVAAANMAADAPTEIGISPYAGAWQGTIHVGDTPMGPLARQVRLELGENGAFHCPTHDLVTLKENSPSLGWVKWEDGTITFLVDTATGVERHSFLFFHVPREERNDRIPPKLYLHDVDSDIHLHLTPVPITPPGR